MLRDVQADPAQLQGDGTVLGSPKLSPFSGKSPHGQLQALEHMFQALPKRNSKLAEPSDLHKGSLQHTSKPPSVPSRHALDRSCTAEDTLRSHKHSVASSQTHAAAAPAAAQTAKQGACSRKQSAASSSKPSSRDVFRLSFSPTGIPIVEPTQPQTMQGTESLAGSAVDCNTDRSHSAAPGQLGGSWLLPVPAAPCVLPTAAAQVNDGMQQAASSDDQSAADNSGSAEQSSTVRSAEPTFTVHPIGPMPAVEVGEPVCTTELASGLGEAPQLSSPSAADAVPIDQQAADPAADITEDDQPEAEGADFLAEATPLQSSQAALLNPSVTPESSTLPLPTYMAMQTTSGADAQTSCTAVEDAASSQPSCTPCRPCSAQMPLASPMLTWLQALGTRTAGAARTLSIQERSAASTVPEQGDEPLLSPSTASMQASQTSAASEASTLLPAATAAAEEQHLHSNDNLQPAQASLNDVANSAALGSPPRRSRLVSSQQYQLSTAVLLKQASAAALPSQAGPELAGKSPQPLQATPAGRLKQVAPHLGPPTGISGLTTPASATEMHRCVSRF